MNAALTPAGGPENEDGRPSARRVPVERAADVHENEAVLHGTHRVAAARAKGPQDRRLGDRLDHLVVEVDPLPVRLGQGHVVPVVGASAGEGKKGLESASVRPERGSAAGRWRRIVDGAGEPKATKACPPRVVGCVPLVLQGDGQEGGGAYSRSNVHDHPSEVVEGVRACLGRDNVAEAELHGEGDAARRARGELG